MIRYFCGGPHDTFPAGTGPFTLSLSAGHILSGFSHRAFRAGHRAFRTVNITIIRLEYSSPRNFAAPRNLSATGNIFKQNLVGHVAVLGRHIARCKQLQHPTVQRVGFDRLPIGDVIRIPSALAGDLGAGMFSNGVAMVVKCP